MAPEILKLTLAFSKPKSQNKNVNISRTERTFNMKQTTFFINFKGLSKKQIKTRLLECEGLILSFPYNAIVKEKNYEFSQLENISVSRTKCWSACENRSEFSFNPAGIYLLKVNNRNTRARCEICSKLTIKKPERGQWHRSGVNFENI